MKYKGYRAIGQLAHAAKQIGFRFVHELLDHHKGSRIQNSTDAAELRSAVPDSSPYKIGPFKSTEGNRAKLKVKVCLNIHGIVSVESATMLEDEEVDVPVSASKDNWKEAVKVDTDEDSTNSSATAESDVNMHEVKIATDSSGLGVENGVPETEEKSTRMETDTKLPWWETRGAILVALLHAGPVEFIYYWLHRALHHHFLYSRYHSHHHASIVTEPIISVIHPFGEEMAYFLLFAIPLMSMAFTGTGSIASLIGYLMYIDFMNYLGHCNFELVPKWLFEAFPPLKYLMHTPSFHSLHHTQFRTNYSLFVPFYDYVYGTVDKSSDKLYKTCVKGKGEEVPVVVHLTQLTTMESIYHLRLGFASLSSRPYEPKWYILLLSPLKFASMLLTWAYGTTFTVERSRMRMLHAETWAIPRYSFQYKSLSQREDINDLIEKAILEAEDRGAKVMSFGLMNQENFPSCHMCWLWPCVRNRSR